MRLTMITPPALSPVDLDTLKAYVRVYHDDEDTLLQGLIDAAVDYLDGPVGILGRMIMEQTWEVALPAWPSGEYRLPVVGLSSAQVVYDDADGVEISLDASQWSVSPLAVVSPARPILTLRGASGPVLGQGEYPVRLRVTGGAATVEALSPGLGKLVMMIAGHWFARGDSGGAVDEFPASIRSMLARYRVKL